LRYGRTKAFGGNAAGGQSAGEFAMETKYPLDYALETDDGAFRIVTEGDVSTYAAIVYRRLPDGPHTEVYRQPSSSRGDALANHDRVVEAVKAGTLP